MFLNLKKGMGKGAFITFALYFATYHPPFQVYQPPPYFQNDRDLLLILDSGRESVWRFQLLEILIPGDGKSYMVVVGGGLHGNMHMTDTKHVHEHVQLDNPTWASFENLPNLNILGEKI